MAIKSFSGKYQFLDNFFACDVVYEGIMYPSTEHAFQAAKTTDVEIRKKFRLYETFADAKRKGRQLKLRPDWEEIKDTVMYEVVKDKFTRNARLKEMLLATGDEYLEEGNRHGDRYWGTVSGEGRNQLGKTLMRVRQELREEN